MKLLTLFPPTVALANRPASWVSRVRVTNGKNNMLYVRYYAGHPRAAAIAMHELREARRKWRNPFINRFLLNVIGEVTEAVVERDHYGMSLDEALAEGARQLGSYDGAPGYEARLDMLEDEIPAAERWLRRNRRLVAKALRLQA